MGLFDLLFKSRPARNEEKRGEDSGPKAEAAPPDPAAFLVPRDLAPTLAAGSRPALIEPARSGVQPSPSSRQIVVTLGDVLSRIPSEFLQKGAADPRRELRFGPDEFFADIPRGRVTVALSNIAAQCPEVFRVPVTDDDDREVRLPLQKLLDQLVGPEPGMIRGARPPAVPPVPMTLEPPAKAPALEAEKFSASPTPEPTTALPPAASERTIRLSLSMILAGCPDDVFAGERPCVDDAVQATLPFEPIERQLTNAVVEITGARFLASLPVLYRGRIALREGVMVPLPLEEIFRNLPAQTEPPHAPEPTPVVGPSSPPAAEGAAPLPPDSSTEPNVPVESAIAPEVVVNVEPVPTDARAAVVEVGIVPEPKPIPQPASEPPSVAAIPEASTTVAEPSAPAPVIGGTQPREAFQFFAPARPLPRIVPPPPVGVRTNESGMLHDSRSGVPLDSVEAAPPQAPAEPADAAALVETPLTPPALSARPTVAPSLRALEVRPSLDATVPPDTSAPTLHAAGSLPTPEGAAPNATFQLSRPLVARPFVILPPPIGGASRTEPPLPPSGNASDAPHETTSDQTAVLEFLTSDVDSESRT